MKFWIGDPCYHDVMKENENWDIVLNLTDYFSSQDVVEIGGRKVAGVGTENGDGSYNSGYDKFVYHVDSGTIGFVEWKEGDEENPLMNLVEFTDVPSVECDKDGTIYIGDDVSLIMIYTGYDPNDYYDHQEDDYGDYDYDENDDEE